MTAPDDDWDRLLNPFRYNEDGTKTEAARRQDVAAISMQLNSAGGGNNSGTGDTSSVDTKALTSHAITVDQINGSFSSVDYTAKNSTAATSLGFSGWQIVQGLSALLPRWNDQKEALEKRLSGISEKLRQNSSNYTTTDESQADDFSTRMGR